MKVRNRLVLALSCLISGTAAAADPALRSDVKAVETTLDAFHAAASKSDGAAYFALFAPDGVFIGTDASERWPVADFKRYAQPFFAKHQGWTYVPRARHVDLAPSGDVAWFDELLDNASYGVCRGSGVLRRIAGAWKISQYHLTIPVPNALARRVVDMIRSTLPPPPEAGK